MTLDVVSFGSLNVDCIREVDSAQAARWAERYDWFPAAGRTVSRETLPDVGLPGPDEFRLGGKGANQAVAAARAGAETAHLGRVGLDAPGYEVRETLQARGVDTAPMGVVETETGKAHVFVDETGENRIVVVPGANGTVDRDYAASHREGVAASDVLLLQNEVPVPAMDALLDALDARRSPPTVVLDPAPPEGIAPLLEHPTVAYVTPNDHEYEMLADAGALEGFDGTVIRTRGAEDLVVSGAESFTVTPPLADPVDTTGAGDTFNGFLAARLVAGDDLREAVEVAVAAGAVSTEAEGAQTAVPSLAEALERRENGD